MNNHTRLWVNLVLVGFAILLIDLLSPILTPFLAAAILAYLFSPLIQRLERWHIHRIIGILLLFCVLILILVGLTMLLIPLLEQQVTVALTRWPEFLQRMIAWISPWLEKLNPGTLDLNSIKETVLQNWQSGSHVLAKTWTFIFHSTQNIITFFAEILITLVVTFYLLKDWKKILERSTRLVMEYGSAKTMQILSECGDVLSAFFRGQLMVMLILAIIYSTGLWIVGIDIGILIGIMAGLLSIVPYLGFTTGLVLSLIASSLQYHTPGNLLAVLIVFGVGQAAESAVLTPFLIGHRVGLHPVAVIFSVLAFGKLFGFTGVLLAVPSAAVIMVLLKHAHEFAKTKLKRS